MNSLATPEGTAILVLQNFHRFLHSAEIVQALAQQIVAGKQNRTILVILSPVVQLPVEREGVGHQEGGPNAEVRPGRGRPGTGREHQPVRAIGDELFQVSTQRLSQRVRQRDCPDRCGGLRDIDPDLP